MLQVAQPLIASFFPLVNALIQTSLGLFDHFVDSRYIDLCLLLLGPEEDKLGREVFDFLHLDWVGDVLVSVWVEQEDLRKVLVLDFHEVREGPHVAGGKVVEGVVVRDYRHEVKLVVFLDLLDYVCEQGNAPVFGVGVVLFDAVLWEHENEGRDEVVEDHVVAALGPARSTLADLEIDSEHELTRLLEVILSQRNVSLDRVLAIEHQQVHLLGVQVVLLEALRVIVPVVAHLLLVESVAINLGKVREEFAAFAFYVFFGAQKHNLIVKVAIFSLQFLALNALIKFSGEVSDKLTEMLSILVLFVVSRRVA